jgi:hypothetical protein
VTITSPTVEELVELDAHGGAHVIRTWDDGYANPQK